MEVDQRKVSLIAEFLETSFIGCSVYDRSDSERDAHFYQIVDEASGKVVHRILVSRAFLDNHAENDIVPSLQNLALLVCLRMAGGRRVHVRSQMIQIEKGA